MRQGQTASRESQSTAETGAVGSGRDRDEILEALFDRVGAKASAEAVFGTPIERADNTVVPVASIRWGGGVGGSRTHGPRNGGAGIVASPVGYIVISGDKVEFRRISNPLAIATTAITGVLAGAILLRAVAQLVLARARRGG